VLICGYSACFVPFEPSWFLRHYSRPLRLICFCPPSFCHVQSRFIQIRHSGYDLRMLPDAFLRRWYRLPPKARTLLVLAALLVCGGAGLLAERLYFRATASRVEGTVIDHDKKGREVVEYWWEGKRHQHDASGPSQGLPVGAKVGVYVPPKGPPAVRLAGWVPLLFMPGWVCIMPATFFAAYAVVIAIWGTRRRAVPPAAHDHGGI
jgi:hypothetical protein